MKRILCVWELGGHLGHVTRLAALVPALRAEGFEVFFALSDLTSSLPVLGHLKLPVFQAPVWQRRVPAAPRRPISLSEILPHFGYYDAEGLASMLVAWRTLITAIKPDLILGDYCPNAFATGRAMGIPTATIGNGFTIPPLKTPLPSYVPDSGEVVDRLQRSDKRVLETLNRAVRLAKMPALSSVAELWRTDETFLCSYPELDYYERPTDTQYWGVTDPVAGVTPPALSSGSNPRVVAYLKHGHDQRVLDAIVKLGWTGYVFAPSVPPALVRRYQAHGLWWSAQPLSLRHALPLCDVAICHAGHDTTIHGLLAGKPQLLLPLHMEQRLLANRVETLGAGMVPPKYDEPDVLADTLQRMVSEHAFAANAKAFAAKYPERPDVAVNIAKRCRNMI